MSVMSTTRLMSVRAAIEAYVCSDGKVSVFREPIALLVNEDRVSVVPH